MAEHLGSFGALAQAPARVRHGKIRVLHEVFPHDDQAVSDVLVIGKLPQDVVVDRLLLATTAALGGTTTLQAVIRSKEGSDTEIRAAGTLNSTDIDETPGSLEYETKAGDRALIIIAGAKLTKATGKVLRASVYYTSE